MIEEAQNKRVDQKVIQRQKKVEQIEIRKKIQKMMDKKRRYSNTYYLQHKLSQFKNNLSQGQLNLKLIKQQGRNEGIQECQNQLNQINQQLEQLLQVDQWNLQSQIIKEFQQERLNQELSNYKILMSSKLEDLKQTMCKEDFNEPSNIQSQHNHNPSQDRFESIQQIDQVISDNRNRITTYIIKIHLFIDNRINKVKQDELILSKLQLELDQQKSQLLLMESSNSDENHVHLNKIQKVIMEFEQKKQGLLLLQSNLETYLFLKNIHQENKKSSFRLDSLKNELQEQCQKVISINSQLMETCQNTVSEIYQNLQSEDIDFTYQLNQLKNKINEIDQALNDRWDLIKSKKEAEIYYEQQQLQNSRYQNQINQLEQVLEKQIPKILRFSEKEILTEKEKITQKLMSYEQEILKFKQQLVSIQQTCDKTKQQRIEIKRSIFDIEESISNVKKAKSTYSYQYTEISIKLNLLKQKKILNIEELLQDLNQIIAQIKAFTIDDDEIEIQRGLEIFVQELNQRGSQGSSDAILKPFILKQKELDINIEHRVKILLDKKNQLEQQIQNGPISQKVSKQEELEIKQRLKEEIKNYKKHKQKLKNRFSLICQTIQQLIEMIKLHDNL